MKAIGVIGVSCLFIASLACSVPRTKVVGEIEPGQTIDHQGKFLILSCDDAQERGEDVTKGSANGLVSAIRDRMMAHSIKLSVTQSKELEAAYAEAQRTSFDYLVRPTFTNWEDNATAWSGNGDKAGISLEVFDVHSHTLVAAASYNRTATGFTLAPGSPMRFINDAADKTLAQIFHWKV